MPLRPLTAGAPALHAGETCAPVTDLHADEAKPAHLTDVQVGERLSAQQREAAEPMRAMIARAIHEHDSEEAFAKRAGRDRSWLSARIDPRRKLPMTLRDFAAGAHTKSIESLSDQLRAFAAAKKQKLRGGA